MAKTNWEHFFSPVNVFSLELKSLLLNGLLNTLCKLLLGIKVGLLNYFFCSSNSQGRQKYISNGFWVNHAMTKLTTN